MTVPRLTTYRAVKPAYVADFDEVSDWSKILEDVRAAKHRIVIQATSRHCELILKHIELIRECLKRGVVICVIIQPPETFRGLQLPPYGSFHTFVYRLREPGAHVTFKQEVRSLLLVVDDCCAWESSIEPTDDLETRIEPSILRFSNIEVINQAVSSHNLNGCSECIEMREKCFAIGDPYLLLQGLKVYRTRVGLTQAEVAGKIRFTQGWVSKVESGHPHAVSVEALSRLSTLCNVTPVLVPNYLIPRLLKQIFEHLERHQMIGNTDSGREPSSVGNQKSDLKRGFKRGLKRSPSRPD